MQKLDTELHRRCVNAIRFLAIDAVEKANSGHPGMPMGAAEIAFVLWTRHLRYNPKDPRWPGRDRFVLSAGHASMLIYGLLHFAGFDVTLDDIKAFRQYGSRTPGHPEYGLTPGVEATTGPLGQGLSNAVGMALSARMLAARLDDGAGGLHETRVYCLCSDGDVMEGVTSEAASLAGHLGLSNLIALYDDNKVSLAGKTEVTFTEDVSARYAAQGWFVQRVDGMDPEAVHRAIETAKAQGDKPSFIQCRTVLGYGSPHKAETHEAHGSPLGKDETKATKENLGWPLEPTFLIPDEVRAVWAARAEELRPAYEEWQARLQSLRQRDPAKAKLLDQLSPDRQLPADLPEQLFAAVSSVNAAESTRKLGQSVIQKAAQLMPALVGGSADLDPSTLTYLKDGGDVQKGRYGGRNIHFGVREHAMGAIVNGLAYEGAFIPFGATFLLFSDYMRPPIRLAALSHLQALFVYTHDSIFLGEDGPTHQPVEQICALRAIPNVELWRPSDPSEVAAAWAAALERKKGPTVMALTRQKIAPLQRSGPADVRTALRGAYALVEPQGAPELVLIATGSEVPATQAALALLPEALRSKTRLVSMPCVERFLKWPRDEQRKLLPRDGKARLVAVEAALGIDWFRLIGDGLVIGVDHFGASAPDKALADAYNLTPAKIAARIQAWLAGGA
jgi:transketolase